ncbi:MAG: phosphate transport system regulatory protein PhoU, partial [Ruminococcus sp.]|nr:phosphate transport system regulatory protein PhoU [Ruminococcus sp.]
MRSRFDEQLSILNTEMIEMGALCEESIALASKALTTGDITLAKKVVPISSDIDQKERDIEARCLKLLLQQQPVARDLRQI